MPGVAPRAGSPMSSSIHETSSALPPKYSTSGARPVALTRQAWILVPSAAARLSSSTAGKRFATSARRPSGNGWREKNRAACAGEHNERQPDRAPGRDLGDRDEEALPRHDLW